MASLCQRASRCSNSSLEDWKTTLNVNVLGVVNTIKAFVPAMQRQPHCQALPRQPLPRHMRRVACPGCHTPKHATRRDYAVSALAGQLIWPYSDLLLHDMGEALADGRPEASASGREWRTAPLWGIGLTATVNGHTRFLHDGRARNLTEAILWHGGEAEPAREAFRHFPAGEREALLSFLRSL